MATQAISSNQDKRLLQLHANRNIQMMDRLMNRIRKDIHTIGEQSKTLEEFQEKIALYTTVNLFNSERYGEETWNIVKSINQLVR